MVTLDKWNQLKERMKKLSLSEEDLQEKFILGSGSGGQKINKTSSCVYLKHLPSGLEIKCQQDRSRDINRFLARKELCEKIEDQLYPETSPRLQKIEKLRKQKKRRSRKAKNKNTPSEESESI